MQSLLLQPGAGHSLTAEKLPATGGGQEETVQFNTARSHDYEGNPADLFISSSCVRNLSISICSLWRSSCRSLSFSCRSLSFSCRSLSFSCHSLSFSCHTLRSSFRPSSKPSLKPYLKPSFFPALNTLSALNSSTLPPMISSSFIRYTVLWSAYLSIPFCEKTQTGAKILATVS